MHRSPLETIEFYLPFLIGAARVLVLLAGGYALTLIVGRVIRTIRNYSVRVMSRQQGGLDGEIEKRANTVASAARRILLTLLWAALLIMSLEELGFKINALLAGAGISAGIIGVAVGFGAQSLIKDLLGGLFLLIENQIRVKDVAIVNGIGGSVEEINLRTTVLRAENGAVHIIPNGSIQTLANLTREFSYFVFDISLNYDQDADRAIEILRAIALELRSDPQYTGWIVDDLEVMGIDRLTATGLQLKARIKTRPTRQWVVGREMNRRIQDRFKAEQIDLSSGPTLVRLEAREDLKAAVREVLAELQAEGARKDKVG